MCVYTLDNNCLPNGVSLISLSGHNVSMFSHDDLRRSSLLNHPCWKLWSIFDGWVLSTPIDRHYYTPHMPLARSPCFREELWEAGRIWRSAYHSHCLPRVMRPLRLSNCCQDAQQSHDCYGIEDDNEKLKSNTQIHGEWHYTQPER